MNFIKKMIVKYKDFILYGIFGVFTTIVNIVVYYLLSHICNLPVLLSTILAWVAAVFFAYITNRSLVFHSQAKSKKDIIKEIVSFFACRVATGLVDIAIMFVFVDLLHFNDMIIKVIANIVVIILNYVASKLVIFKHNKEKDI